MLKILDRYIIIRFLSTFALTVGVILAIAVGFDISEKIDDFLEKGASAKEIIVDYYLNFIIFYGNLFSSLLVFIATILFTSRLTNNTEVVAILTGGVSFKRLMWPFFISATIIALVSLGLNHYIIPITNIDRLEFEHTYLKNKKKDHYKNIHRQILPGHIIYFENFNKKRQSGYHFSYEVYEENRLVKKIKADFLRLDTATGKWTLDNYDIRVIHPDGREVLEQGRKKDTIFSFTSEEIVPELTSIQVMQTPELLDFIDAEKLRGSESINSYLIHLHQRSSYPIATYILVLIGVSISSKKKRGGLGLNLTFGLILCVVYIFFMQISTTFATVGDFSPLVAVWLPNILFSFIAGYLYYIAPK